MRKFNSDGLAVDLDQIVAVRVIIQEPPRVVVKCSGVAEEALVWNHIKDNEQSADTLNAREHAATSFYNKLVTAWQCPTTNKEEA